MYVGRSWMHYPGYYIWSLSYCFLMFFLVLGELYELFIPAPPCTFISIIKKKPGTLYMKKETHNLNVSQKLINSTITISRMQSISSFIWEDSPWKAYCNPSRGISSLRFISVYLVIPFRCSEITATMIQGSLPIVPTVSRHWYCPCVAGATRMHNQMLWGIGTFSQISVEGLEGQIMSHSGGNIWSYGMKPKVQWKAQEVRNDKSTTISWEKQQAINCEGHFMTEKPHGLQPL